MSGVNSDVLTSRKPGIEGTPSAIFLIKTSRYDSPFVSLL